MGGKGCKGLCEYALQSAPDFKPTSIDSETSTRWKNDWECLENKALAAKNSSNRRGGGDKAEATQIGNI